MHVMQKNNRTCSREKEIRVSRILHWLRIDRYYSSEDTFADDIEAKDSSDWPRFRKTI